MNKNLMNIMKMHDNPNWNATLFNLAFEKENYLKLHAILQDQSKDFNAS